MKNFPVMLCVLALALGACGGGGKLDPCSGKSDVCSQADEQRCSHNSQAVEKCLPDADACLVWTVVEDCAASAKSCSSEGGQPRCQTGCQDNCPMLNARRCFNNEIESCQKTSLGCLDWAISEDCTSLGQVCEEVGGIPTCTACGSECSAGTMRCQDDWVQECRQLSKNCFRWQNNENCAQKNALCREDRDPIGCAAICGDNQGCPDAEFCRKDGCQTENGYCAIRPASCPEYQNPVCGCDGITYKNPCFAAHAGVNVARLGTCDGGCLNNGACEEFYYCKKDSCAPTLMGSCIPRPDRCANFLEPVCGCGGESFPNECFAGQAGVNIDYRGLCDGGSCWLNSLCREESFCKMDGCLPEAGVCTTRPSVCPPLYDPVCGCDGKTYDNNCLAAAAGVSVAYKGPCPAKCFTNNDCPKNAFCYLSDCNQKTGQCRPRPEGCPDLYDPVCDCDGQTYDNECLAQQAGMNIDHPGDCKAATCKENGECQPVGEYCHKKTCDATLGWCISRGSRCPDGAPEWVCDCDGTSHENPCKARLAGRNIRHAGKCDGSACFSSEMCHSPLMFCEFVPCAIETGKCRFRPSGCEMFWEPVCGCDKQTYFSGCVARLLGMSVAGEGRCE